MATITTTIDTVNSAMSTSGWTFSGLSTNTYTGSAPQNSSTTHYYALVIQFTINDLPTGSVSSKLEFNAGMYSQIGDNIMKLRWSILNSFDKNDFLSKYPGQKESTGTDGSTTRAAVSDSRAIDQGITNFIHPGTSYGCKGTITLTTNKIRNSGTYYLVLYTYRDSDGISLSLPNYNKAPWSIVITYDRGLSHIYHDNAYRSALTWVFCKVGSDTAAKWHQAIPYMYHNGSWHQCV